MFVFVCLFVCLFVGVFVCLFVCFSFLREQITPMKNLVSIVVKYAKKKKKKENCERTNGTISLGYLSVNDPSPSWDFTTYKAGKK